MECHGSYGKRDREDNLSIWAFAAQPQGQHEAVTGNPEMSRSVKLLAGVLVSLCLCVLMSSCGGEKLPAKRTGITHFPLVDGRIYVYRETVENKSFDFTIETRFGGGTKYPVYFLRVEGADWGQCLFMLQDSSVVFVSSKPEARLEAPELTPEYRQTWMDETIDEGNYWDDPDTGTRTVLASLNESVTTPAGTYDFCARTVTETLPELFDSLTARLSGGRITQSEYDQQSARARDVIERWFAPGVGFVKERFRQSGVVRELVAIKRESRDEK